MIYLDNAATSWPKPACVCQKMQFALTRYGANPGRGGYDMSMQTAEQVYRARQTAARLFGVTDPSRVAFTANCTMGLNMVIQGLAGRGRRIVISSMEHNAVMRPVQALQKQGIEVVTARVNPEDDGATVSAFAQCMTKDTAAVICTHASNVTGEVLPIRHIGALAAERGIPFVVDAAQTAGMLPLHLEEDHVDFICIPGHKGLYGPMGTGLLLTGGKFTLTPVIRGGTGSQSISLEQPDEWPDMAESGTLNVPGILGLEAGMRWVEQHGVTSMHKKELALTQQLYTGLQRIHGIKVYGCAPKLWRHVPLLSLTVDGIPSEEVAEKLAKHGVAVRAGLHCAPAAHRQIGTLSTGTVRLSLSAFTTPCEVDKVCEILRILCKNQLQNPNNMLK